MQELSSSMILKTIVPPSISTSGGSSCTDGPLLRFAGELVLEGDKFEGRFSAVILSNVVVRSFTGCTEIGSSIAVDGFCTGVDTLPPDESVAAKEVLGCVVAAVVEVSFSWIVITRLSPELIPTSLTSLSQLSGPPNSTTFEGYAILIPI